MQLKFLYMLMQARTQVVEKEGSILLEMRCARASAPPRGVWGMLPQEISPGFLDLLRSS